MAAEVAEQEPDIVVNDDLVFKLVSTETGWCIYQRIDEKEILRWEYETETKARICFTFLGQASTLGSIEDINLLPNRALVLVSNDADESWAVYAVTVRGTFPILIMGLSEKEARESFNRAITSGIYTYLRIAEQQIGEVVISRGISPASCIVLLYSALSETCFIVEFTGRSDVQAIVRYTPRGGFTREEEARIVFNNVALFK